MTTHISDTIIVPTLRERENSENTHDRLLSAREAGEDIHQQNAQGETLLMLAARMSGRLDMPRLLLAKGIGLEITDRKGYTALSHAVLWHHTELVRLLISAGADVHVRDKWEHTLLMLVVQSAHRENEAIIRLLLAAGVDPHAKDVCGYTAWTYARIFGATPEVEALLRPQEELTA